MSVVIGHTRWPDNLSSLVSSQASLIRESTPKSSGESSKITPQYVERTGAVQTPVNPLDQSRLSEPSSHKRPASGLFDIIYDESPIRPHSRPLSADLTTEQLKSPSYIEIEKAILAGHKVSSPDTSPNAPIVTMIDGGNVRRSGSVVSHSAGLRHRNTIQRRNKIAKRTPPVQKPERESSVFSSDAETKAARKTKPRKSRIFPVFPVRRRTSYKYYPVSKTEAPPRFNSPKDVDDFFMRDHVTSLMKDMLPRTMQSFEFQNLLRPKPHLRSSPANFLISRDAQFTMVESEAAQTSTSATSGVAMHARGISTSTGTNDTTTSKVDSDFVKRRLFLTEVQENYRKITFAGKRKIPLKLETVLPRESEMMTTSERDQMNVQVLFEILLRRTIAAKIGFRLKGHTKSDKSVARNSSSSSTFSSTSMSSSSSSASEHPSPKEWHGQSYKSQSQKHPHTGWSQPRSQGSEASAQTPGSFPSPQFSLSSHKLNPEFYTFTGTPCHEYRALASKPSVFELRYPGPMPQRPHKNPALVQSGVSSGSSDSSHYYHSPTSIYSEVISYDLPLGNVDMSLLQPFARSHTTLSLHTNSGDGSLDSDTFYQSSGDVALESGFSSGMSINNHRGSRSTAHTSISREINVAKVNGADLANTRNPDTNSSQRHPSRSFHAMPQRSWSSESRTV